MPHKSVPEPVPCAVLFVSMKLLIVTLVSAAPVVVTMAAIVDGTSAYAVQGASIVTENTIDSSHY